jgi:hypothetical protein
MKSARRRVAGRRTPPSSREVGVSQVVSRWVNPIARLRLVVLPIIGSAVLFAVCQYLSSRFDVG